MPQADPRHVFVYGTLRRGERNDINRLRPAAQFVGIGHVAGALHRFDWYPGLSLGGTSRVVGEVYRIGAELERQLDAIEEVHAGADSEYRKREIDVEVGTATYRCLVYEINPARIAQGIPMPEQDWLARGD